MLKLNLFRYLSVPIFFGTCFFTNTTLLAQSEVLPAGLQFFPASLNTEFTEATRVALGRQSLPGTGGLMLAGTMLNNSEAENNISHYQQAIRKLEISEGSYTPTLYEPLLSLGLLLQQEAQHADALQAFERAAFINKTGSGLYSTDQISLTRHQITSLKALGDYPAVYESLERLLLIHQKLYGNNDNKTAFVLKDLGAWQLEGFLQGLSRHSNTRLMRAQGHGGLSGEQERYNPAVEDLYLAQQTFINAITTVVNNKDVSDPRLIELENKLIATYYLNARRDLIMEDPDALWQSPRRDFSSIKRLKKMEGLPVDFRHGEVAYKRQLQYLQRSAEVTVAQLSSTMLAMADWYQLFGQFESAREQRELLTTMLQRAELSESDITRLIQKDSPVLLPTFIDSPLSAREFNLEQTKGHIDLTIQITPWGEVSDVDTLGISEGTPEAVIAHLVSMVKNARFRVDSDEGSTSGIRYYYQY